MLRRACLAFALLAATPALADWDTARLDREIGAIERQSKGRLGVALLDLKDRKAWSHRGAEAFPMQSVFKLPLAVAALQAVEAGRFRLDQPVTIVRTDLSILHSPLARAFTGDRRDYPLRELIARAAGESDNTAADVLMRVIGGPKVVTAMLRQGGIAGMSIDRYEREFQPQVFGLRPYGLDETVDTGRFMASVKALDRKAGAQALERALTDKRDAATPEASVAFLEALAQGNWLREPTHRAFLDQVITQTSTGAARIRAGLPPGARLAHKTGSGLSFGGVNHALNDIGIVTLPEGRAFAIAVYLAGSRADDKRREATHAAVARLAVSALRLQISACPAARR